MTEWADALYQVPDYTPPGDLPDPHVGTGDPIPLAQRLRRAFGGDPVGPNTAVTVDATLVRLTVPPGALSCILQIQTAPIRWTTDGTLPTASNGVRADPGAVLELTGWASMVGLAMSREGAVSAVVVPVFYL